MATVFNVFTFLLVLLFSSSAAVIVSPFTETFDTTLSANGWSAFGGGTGTPCVPMISGKAATFTATIPTRYLTSPVFDTTNANYLYFYFVLGGSVFTPNCPSSGDPSEIVLLQYSLDGGSTWTVFSQLNTTYGVVTPTSIAIPPTAMATAVQFQFLQSNIAYPYASTWAIDNFYFGFPSTTLTTLLDSFSSGTIDNHFLYAPNGAVQQNFCNQSSALVFDGVSGQNRSLTTVEMNAALAETYPVVYFDNFNTGSYASFWASASGSQFSSTCSPDGSNAVLFFDSTPRQLITQAVDTTSVTAITFFYNYGAGCYSSGGLTQGFPLLLAYSIDQGNTYTLLQSFTITQGNQFRKVVLPTAAINTAVIFKFYQSGSPSQWGDTISLDTVRFESSYASIAPYHVFQFDLYVGTSNCFGSTSPIDDTNAIYVEYSVDKGLTFNPIQGAPTATELYNGLSLSSQILEPTIFPGPSYSTWKHITIPLRAPKFPSNAVMFRIRQGVSSAAPYSSSNAFAVTNIYFGSNCLQLCSGQGNCQADGTCACDAGFIYSGGTCVMSTAMQALLPVTMSEDFSSGTISSAKWNAFYGYSLLTAANQCLKSGVGFGIAAQFSSNNTYSYFRRAETDPLDTTATAFIAFTLLFGGNGAGYASIGCSAACGTSCPVSENIMLLYSTNQGNLWVPFASLSSAQFSSPLTTLIYLDAALQVPGLRFRWEQYRVATNVTVTGFTTQCRGEALICNITSPFEGFLRSWILDTVSVSGSLTQTLRTSLQETFNPLGESNWLTISDASSQPDTCSSNQPSLQFNGISTSRYATTSPLALTSDESVPVGSGFYDGFENGFTWTLYPPASTGIALIGSPRLTPAWCYAGNGQAWFLMYAKSFTYPIRSVATPAITTTNVNQISFVFALNFGGSTCNTAVPRPVQLLYSSSPDGSSFTSSLQTFTTFIPSTTYTIVLPTLAKQPTMYFNFSQVKALANIGGTYPINTFLLDDFTANVIRVLSVPTNKASFMEFMLKMATCPSSLVPYDNTNDIYVFFSLDYDFTATQMQLTWQPGIDANVFAMPSRFTAYSFQQYVRVIVPVAYNAVSNATVLRITQNGATETAANTWSIANVYVGADCPGYCSGHGTCITRNCTCDSGYTWTAGTCKAVPGTLRTLLQDNFEWSGVPPSNIWAQTANAFVDPTGCYNASAYIDGQRLYLTGSSGLRFIQTVDLDLSKAEFFQFYYAVGCTPLNPANNIPGSGNTNYVSLSYSNDGGVRWTFLSYMPLFTGYVTVDLIQYSSIFSGGSTRLMLYQAVFAANLVKWSLDDFYIGGCNGCNPTAVDENFTPFNRDNWYFYPGGAVTASVCGAASALTYTTVNPGQRYAILRHLKLTFGASSSFYSTFDTAVETTVWSLANSTNFIRRSVCGTQGASSSALSLYSASATTARVLTSVVTSGRVDGIAFWARAGGNSCDPPEDGDNLFLEYLPVASSNWVTISTFSIASTSYAFTSGAVVTVSSLPASAQTSGVSFRFRQSTFETGLDVWTIDSVMFTRTADTIATSSYYQFSINMGCGSPFRMANDLLLQYSIDYGNTWVSVNSACTPSLIGTPRCSLGFAMPATFNSDALTNGFVRVTAPFQDTLASSSSVRLRLSQSGSSFTNFVWSISSVYVGNGCPGYCGGHGRCQLSGVCACDSGYVASGGTCVLTTPRPTTLLDRFETVAVDLSLWSEAVNAAINTSCGVVSENTALVFSGGNGAKFATTVDLNTVNATFIQFTLLISGACGGLTTSGSDVMLLYSVDGGVLWNFITSYDATNAVYQVPTSVGVAMPSGAKTPSTRFRWYQARYTSGIEQRIWALDDVYIGGSAAPAVQIVDSFNPMLTGNYLFNPYMIGSSSYCTASLSADIALPSVSSSASRGLIVRPTRLGVTSSQLYYDSVVSTSITSAFWLTTMNINLNCGAFSAYAFSSSSTSNTMETIALNLLSAVSVSFWIKMGSSSDRFSASCTAPASSSTVTLAYTVDGGSAYITILTMAASESLYTQSSGTTVQVTLPSGALTSSSRLRWSKSDSTGSWSLDEVSINSATSNNSAFAVVTLQVGCGTPTSAVVNLEYSLDLGNTWTAVVPACPLCGTFSDASSWVWDRFYNPSTAVYDFKTFILPMPLALSFIPQRFRLLQSSGDSSVTNWAVSYMYIGNACPNMCGGHGRCTTSGCVCFGGFSLDTTTGTCLPVANFAPTFLRISFDFSLSPLASLVELNGGVLATVACGSITLSSGSMMVFATATNSTRLLTTVDMNTSSATTLQFLSTPRNAGTGCNYATPVENIAVACSSNGGITWTVIYEFIPTVTQHVVDLPVLAKGNAVRFRFYQYSVPSSLSGWAIDDIYIGASSNVPSVLSESFDPVIEANWIFRGLIDSLTCSINGRGQLMHFGSISGQLSAVTRSINMTSTSSVYTSMPLFDSFESSLNSNQWNLAATSGCVLSNACGVLSGSNALVFGQASLRMATTAAYNTLFVQSLSFWWATGSGATCDGLKSATNGIVVAYSTNGGSTWTTISTLFQTSFAGLVQIPLTSAMQTASTQFRWSQSTFDGDNAEVWALDNVQFIFAAPAGPFVQMSLVRSCGVSASGSASLLMIETTTDRGVNWNAFAASCTPGETNCGGYFESATAISQSETTLGSPRLIFPIQPSTIISSATRFRVRTSGQPAVDFGLDDVFIGSDSICPRMCSGHGTCLASGCLCDRGYSGASCQVLPPLASSFTLTIANLSAQIWNRLAGQVLNSATTCGSPESTLFFTGPAPRLAETIDFDTRNVSTVHVGFGCGSACGSFNAPTDLVHMEFSTSGGITWHYLQTMPNAAYSLISLELPAAAQTLGTRFRLRQPAVSAVDAGQWSLGAFQLGLGGPSVCGDLVCELDLGEDCNSCPGDCALPLSCSSLCNATPCRNTGTCVDQLSTYQCICPVGITGRQCESVIDFCTSSPCNNGGSCLSFSATFNCTCAAGFTGPVCESDLDECLSSPCLHGSTCVQTANGNGFYCLCSGGWTGWQCGSELQPCMSAPCANGGICTPIPASNNVSCNCSGTGFSGSLCSVNVDDCTPEACGRGMCIDGINTFVCNCSHTGRTGAYCELDLDECSSSPCQNGGVCANLDNAFNCTCSSSRYLGIACQIDSGICGTDIFTAPTGCQAVTGTLSLTGNLSDTALASLQSLKAVDMLIISGAVSITDLSALQSLVSVTSGDVIIENCPQLRTLAGLQQLTSINGSLIVRNNTNLSTLSGLVSPLSVTGSLIVENCPSLLDFGALQLTVIGQSLVIKQNSKLPSLAGLRLPSRIAGDVKILNNSQLASFFASSAPAADHRRDVSTGGALSDVVTIGGTLTVIDNGALTDVDALHNLLVVNGSVWLQNNPTLFSLGGLESIISIAGFISIHNNSGFLEMCSNIIDDLLAATLGIKSGTVVVQDVYTGLALTILAGIDALPYPSLCLNGGVCAEPDAGLFTCVCPSNFYGTSCEMVLDSCLTNTCANAGTCLNGVNSFTCECPSNYGGLLCQDCTTGRYGPGCSQLCSSACLNSVCFGGLLGNASCVACPSGRYGPACDICYCLNGGSCNFAGVCMCPAGYTGSLCEARFYYCTSSPCMNGGTCSDTAVGQYTCACFNTGYTGTFCQNDVDECSTGSNVCTFNTGSNNVCVNTQGSYLCVCADGYYGTSQERTTATCTACGCDPQGSTGITCDSAGTCTCLSTYRGMQCQQPASLQACLPFTFFANSYAGSTGCFTRAEGDTCSFGCDAGYVLQGDTFSFCQSNLQWSVYNSVCAPQCPFVAAPMNGAGSCPITTIVGLRCLQSCNIGYAVSGSTIRTCTDFGLWSGSNVNCTNIDDCAAVSCSNGGTCLDGIQSYLCVCPTIYFGANCELSQCDSQPCLNGGRCSAPTSGNTFVCDCTDTGYTGPTCNVDVNECTTDSTNICLSTANFCFNIPGSYQCKCASGFYGPAQLAAQAICTPCACNATGSANTTCDSSGRCTCRPFFSGPKCSVAVPLQICPAYPFFPQGLPASDGCSSRELNDECDFACEPGYVLQGSDLSAFCTDAGVWTSASASCIVQCPAISEPVNGDGACEATSIVGLTCYQQCLAGFQLVGNSMRTCTNGGVWSGTAVSCVNIDDCISSPCLNGGHCIDGIESFTCNCTTIYFGDSCEDSQCDSSPCQNGGVCGADARGQLVCNCGGTGFGDEYCQNDINECSSPALHVCLNTTNQCTNYRGTYTCGCAIGYYGAVLERQPVVSCVACLCNNTGSVSVACDSLGHCTCKDGYSGPRCDVLVSAQVCPVFTLPAQASATSSGCSTRTVGDVCSFTCDAGYLQTGDTNSTCLNSAVWSFVSSTCTAQCPFVPAPVFGTPSCPATIVPSTVCAQRCISGYQLTGSSSRTCSSGFWSGVPVACTEINECASSPCQHGGTCVDGINMYTCMCPLSRLGLNCEQSVCQSSPCRNGGICVESSVGFICNCTGSASGYSGSLCSQDIDECSMPALNACHAVGNLCSNTIGGYFCLCASTYFGPSMSQAAASCVACDCDPVGASSSVCTSQGYCTCLPGFQGATCSIPILSQVCPPFVLSANTVVNGTGCMDGYIGSVCTYTCRAGYVMSGTYFQSVCQSSGVWTYTDGRCIPECPFVPAPGNGTVDCPLTTTVGLTCRQLCNRGYAQNGTALRTCLDTAQWSGTAVTCTFIDTCLSDPCQNGGTCTSGILSFTCHCPALFFGDMCESSLCDSSPCMHGGVCLSDGNNSYVCDCGFTGFQGQLCELDVDECALSTSNVCSAASSSNVCFNYVGGYACDCVSGFFGVSGIEALADCTSCACNATGSSSTACSPTGQCVCKSGFFGLQCDQIVSLQICPEFPFSNFSIALSLGCQSRQLNDTCLIGCPTGYLLTGDTVSTCLLGGFWSYTDTTCTLQCPQLLPPVNGAGTCSATTTIGLSCRQQCNSGFQLTGTAVRSCSANGQWTGTAVSCVFIDQCLSSPCVNGATCQPVVNGFYCACPPLYVGSRCETNLCLSNPCANGGACYDAGNHSIACDCAGTGYSGVFCHDDVNECANAAWNSCSSTSNVCSNIAGSYICLCRNNYFGSAGVIGGPAPCQACSCNETGSSSLQCSSSGVCSCSLGYTGDRCSSLITCPALVLPALVNATSPGCFSRSYGATCTFTCLSGYVQTGDSFTSCLSDGTWSLLSVQCTPQCPFVPVPLNGLISCPATTVVGTVCRQICRAGYGILGSTLRTCNSSGSWTDNPVSCVEINECLSDPCMNGGSCADALLNYTCTCPPLFYGVHCESSYCDSAPCQNGGTCVAQVGGVAGFGCKCEGTGYSGLYCQTDVNECDGSPCLSEINSCVNSPGTFSCQCAVGYYGVAVTAAPAYACSPCNCALNGSVNAACDLAGRCTCRTGFIGDRCAISTTSQLCDVFPLPSGAQVVSAGCSTRQLNDLCSFVCVEGYVLQGFANSTCGLAGNWSLFDGVCVPQCPLIVAPENGSGACPATTVVGSTCQQRCNDGFSLSGTAQRTCSSVGLWSGSAVSCQRIDECLSSPCFNGGTCVNGILSYSCLCTGVFYGTQCELSVCNPNPCANNGQCGPGAANLQFVCNCANTGFSGTLCTDDVDECVSNTSKCATSPFNVCTNTLGGYICSCVPGYFGGAAQYVAAVSCSACLCNATGSLNSACDLNGQCSCRAGYGGMKCATVILQQVCVAFVPPSNAVLLSAGCTVGHLNDPCQFGCAAGSVADAGSFEAFCQSDGTWTFTTGQCIPQCPTVLPPSFGTGSCSATTTVGQTCTQSCNYGYRLLGVQTRTCQTDGIWSGSPVSCVKINMCDSSPCMNNGTCVDGLLNFTCSCDSNYFGPLCARAVADTDCLSNPCRNGGLCVVPSLGTHICLCNNTGFVGSHCETEINECLSQPCLNGASCVDRVNRFTCTCPAGFTGLQCATNIDECLSGPCQNGGQCVDGINNFSCNCSAIDFSGQQCQQAINQCDSNPCPSDSGTICVDGIFSFLCTCPAGYTGLMCNVEIDECVSSPCSNGGSCVEGIARFTCQCPLPYTGVLCESRLAGLCAQFTSTGNASSLDVTCADTSVTLNATIDFPSNPQQTVVNITMYALKAGNSLIPAYDQSLGLATPFIQFEPSGTEFVAPYPRVHLPISHSVRLEELASLKLYVSRAGGLFSLMTGVTIDNSSYTISADLVHFSVIVGMYTVQPLTAASSSPPPFFILYIILALGGVIVAVVVIALLVRHRRMKRQKVEQADRQLSQEQLDEFMLSGPESIHSLSRDGSTMTLTPDAQRMADVRALRDFARRMSHRQSADFTDTENADPDLERDLNEIELDDGQINPAVLSRRLTKLEDRRRASDSSDQPVVSAADLGAEEGEVDDDNDVINPLTLSRNKSKLPVAAGAARAGQKTAAQIRQEARAINNLLAEEEEGEGDDVLAEDDDIINPLTLSRKLSKLPLSKQSVFVDSDIEKEFGLGGVFEEDEEGDEVDEGFVNPLALSRKLSKVPTSAQHTFGRSEDENPPELSALDEDVMNEFGTGETAALVGANEQLEEIEYFDKMTMDQLAEIDTAIYESRDILKMDVAMALVQPLPIKRQPKKADVAAVPSSSTTTTKDVSEMEEEKMADPVPAPSSTSVSAKVADEPVYGVNLMTNTPLGASDVIAATMVKPMSDTNVMRRVSKPKAVPVTTSAQAAEFASFFKAAPAKPLDTTKGYGDEEDDAEELGALMLDKQFDRTWLTFEAEIGKGNFGYVLKASSTRGNTSLRTMHGVKTLNPEASERDMKDFVRESQLLSTLSHPNVIGLDGVCMDRPPWLIVTPFAQYGDLRGFLQNCENHAHVFVMTYHEYLDVLTQIAQGVAYLCEKRVIHRDLAARNVLLFAQSNVKIADFGLATCLPEGEDVFKISEDAKMPLRWMSFETLANNVYSFPSDVWSLAILFWEVLTNGMQRPYPKVRSEDLMRYITRGGTQSRPTTCAAPLYDLMCECWARDPAERPTAQSVVNRLELMKKKLLGNRHLQMRDLGLALKQAEQVGSEEV